MGGTHVDTVHFTVHFQAECPFKQSERVDSIGEVWGLFLEEAFPPLLPCAFVPEMHGVSP